MDELYKKLHEEFAKCNDALMAYEIYNTAMTFITIHERKPKDRAELFAFQNKINNSFEKKESWHTGGSVKYNIN